MQERKRKEEEEKKAKKKGFGGLTPEKKKLLKVVSQNDWKLFCWMLYNKFASRCSTAPCMCVYLRYLPALLTCVTRMPFSLASFLKQQIIVDFALADLKKEEEEKAAHKKQALDEKVEPLEDNYSLEDMSECRLSFATCMLLCAGFPSNWLFQMLIQGSATPFCTTMHLAWHWSGLYECKRMLSAIFKPPAPPPPLQIFGHVLACDAPLSRSMLCILLQQVNHQQVNKSGSYMRKLYYHPENNHGESQGRTSQRSFKTERGQGQCN